MYLSQQSHHKQSVTIFMQPQCETADHFRHIINNVHSNLKFEIEKSQTTPRGLSLSLLDFKVTIFKDGNSSFEFYKKPLFIHHQSAIPTKSKLNFIRNEWKRIKGRCSSHNNIEQTNCPQNPQRNPHPTNTECSYLKILYISEQLNRKITNTFRKENIPVRTAHKSYILRQALSHTPKECKCTRDKSPISNTGLCLRCDQQCIGSTTRFIHDHNKNYKGFHVKVIISENDPANLRLYEAFYIRKCKPTLNSREECSEFVDLLFQYLNSSLRPHQNNFIILIMLLKDNMNGLYNDFVIRPTVSRQLADIKPTGNQQHVPEVFTRVDFSPVELVKIGRKLASGGSDHHLQLSLHLTPDSLDSVRVGSCKRIDKVLRVVDHEVDVAQVVC
ncbi:hypothetical protein pdam_00023955 [Pocillopora damicornis]|uniref:Uncharacterized protein n=1 Tax=Pocillopora damicornis TaxID=46731 RepID=A0A3M6U742_POCDA|nr:hypothetical protein pdam_00023955 [Pocillopora damicornis]